MKLKNINIMLWGMLIACLIVVVASFVSANTCVGQDCLTNISLNVTPAPTIIITSRFSSITGGIIYDILDSSGAGLGMFFNFISRSLPILLFGIVLIAIIVAIVYSISKSTKLWKVATNEE